LSLVNIIFVGVCARASKVATQPDLGPAKPAIAMLLGQMSQSQCYKISKSVLDHTVYAGVDLHFG